MTKTEMEYYILGLKYEILRAVDDLNELKAYLLSDKFHNDTTVQVSDVLRRLEEVRLKDDESFRKWQTLTPRTSVH